MDAAVERNRIEDGIDVLPFGCFVYLICCCCIIFSFLISSCVIVNLVGKIENNGQFTEEAANISHHDRVHHPKEETRFH
jgi:hypothetical protein